MKIELMEVMKRFGPHAALDALSMAVPAGSVYGLVGPNGAGKTTAIRCVTGVLRPDAGAVLCSGEPVYENPAVKSRMAWIPDEPFFFPQAGVDDMMRFYVSEYPNFDAERFEKARGGLPA